MEKKEAEQRQITIYWWNLGTKVLDFKGSYKEFLLNKNIKVSKIKHPSIKGINGYRFKIYPNYMCRLDTWDSDYVNNANKAIIIYLTLLGDKTIFYDGYGRRHNLNWR